MQHAPSASLFDRPTQHRRRNARICARAALAALLLGLAMSPRPSAGFEQRQMAHDGWARPYQLQRPPQLDPAHPVPLVLVLHGAGGGGARALSSYRWDEAAERHGFVAVAPDAMPAFPDQPAQFLANPRYWNDGRAGGPAAHQQIDDVGFIAALIDRLAGDLPIDRQRIYVTGFSSGAGMTYRLGLDLADRLAAIAPISGQGFGARPPARPLPVLYLVGDQDPLTPLAGGPVRLPWGTVQDHPPARKLPDTWAMLDHCQGKPSIEAPQPQVTLERWHGCAGNAEVLFYTVAGLGHEWAGGRGRLLPEAMTGPYTDAVDVTDLVWNFFRRHRLE